MDIRGPLNPLPQQAPLSGRGQQVAQTFQEASWATHDGYEGKSALHEIGLKSVARDLGATKREILVATVALHQAELIGKSATVRSQSRLDKASVALAQGSALAYLASGGVASGPIGAILADLACRQMDDIRTQSCNTASGADIRDANLAGCAMLQQIADHVEDPALKGLADHTLGRVLSHMRIPRLADHGFHRCRSPIPFKVDHRFHLKPIADSTEAD